MKQRRMPDIKEGGVNVTPLIDIVMVMIVFFMLVAKIGVTRGVDETIALPSALLGKSLDSLSNTLTLNIHKTSEDEPQVNALVDNQERQLHITKRYAAGTDEELERVLKAFRGQFKDTANVIIRADKDLPYRQLELVLLSVANAGIGNISYETRTGDPEAAMNASAQ
jgi:biopolymer transport protein ExbD